jgi:hypothetical protein
VTTTPTSPRTTRAIGAALVAGGLVAATALTFSVRSATATTTDALGALTRERVAFVLPAPVKPLHLPKLKKVVVPKPAPRQLITISRPAVQAPVKRHAEPNEDGAESNDS